MELYYDAERVEQAKKHGLRVQIGSKALTDREYEKLAQVENGEEFETKFNQKTDLKVKTFKQPDIKKRNQEPKTETPDVALAKWLFGVHAKSQTTCPDCLNVIAKTHLKTHQLNGCTGQTIRLQKEKGQFDCRYCDDLLPNKLNFLDHLIAKHNS